MATVHLKRWSRDEYDKMIDAGLFGPEEKVELVEGEIITMAPQHEPHAVAGTLAEDVLRRAFGSACHVRSQRPLALASDSEPEPDIAVVEGRPRDFLRLHPTSALLVVEVSDSSLQYDRAHKGPVYARAGIQEFWIVNLAERVVEVYRDPTSDSAGSTYTARHVFRQGEAIAPLGAPEAQVVVTDILP